MVYGFLLVFFSNFVPKMHRFWDIQLQKCRDLENRVRSPSRSLKMLPCDRTHMTSYGRSIVTMALSRVVSEIFNVEKCRDLEIWVRGHSRSLKGVPFGRPYVFLLVFFSNFVPKMHRFWDIRLLIIQWPWNPGWLLQKRGYGVKSVVHLTHYTPSHSPSITYSLFHSISTIVW